MGAEHDHFVGQGCARDGEDHRRLNKAMGIGLHRDVGPARGMLLPKIANPQGGLLAAGIQVIAVVVGGGEVADGAEDLGRLEVPHYLADQGLLTDIERCGEHFGILLPEPFEGGGGVVPRGVGDEPGATVVRLVHEGRDRGQVVGPQPGHHNTGPTFDGHRWQEVTEHARTGAQGLEGVFSEGDPHRVGRLGAGRSRREEGQNEGQNGQNGSEGRLAGHRRILSGKNDRKGDAPRGCRIGCRNIGARLFTGEVPGDSRAAGRPALSS